ncbi:Nucleoside transporter FUN26 [Candida viswanathii]|uniref:Nucleoside transporter FUN26 n=1 Tax=Candida viswanathii TaxID=5486 RepID=A0A367Y0T4_9ASCO|nr:Nucleoside transporter FUN26 [Candida viswanathii]
MANHESTDEGNTFADSHAVHDPTIFRIKGIFSIKLSQLKYFTFTVIGIALLWPWNCFLSASEYYGERFINSPSLIKVYSSTMMSVSTITSTLYNFYLSQQQTNVNYNFRVQLGFYITIFVFIFMAISCVSTAIITMNDAVFFGILMTMVFLSAVATCLAQNGTMAIVNVMGGIYANAVMVGQAVAGVLPSCALIISILLVGDKSLEQHRVEKDYGVFVYYITASLVCIISLALLYWVTYHKNEVGYQRLNQLMEQEEDETAIVDEQETVDPVHTQKQFVPFMVLWGKLNKIVMTIFFTFGITLIFPVFASVVESVRPDSPHRFFHKNIYIPFIYLVWNLGDLLGRILCGYPRLHMLIKNPRTQLLYSLSRLIFIPLFLTCNIHPGKTEPLIKSDAWYILLQLLFGISNGQLCTSAFMVVGDYCDTDDEKEAAGGFTTF